MDLLLFNIGEIATLSHGDVSKPLSGTEMGNRDKLIIESGSSILVSQGKIMKINPEEELLEEFAPDMESGKSNLIDLLNVNGAAIIPGLVDCHTHLLWSGDRSNEIRLRQKGLTYQDISNQGGGINKTVNSTRKASKKELESIGHRNLSQSSNYGTTTIEAKSGYGLSVDSEIKILQATSALDGINHNVLPTWLGAHDFPKDKKPNEYMDELIHEQLPLVAENNLAKWIDVFCEPGWFNLEQTETLVKNAKSFGLKSRLHVDEFVDSGGLSLAAELESCSADHVGFSNSDSRDKANKSGTMQVFLPGTPYVLGKDLGEGIQECLDNNWIFSLATDFNPNCQTLSLPFVSSLATHRIGIDPLTALVACTRNPASTLNEELENCVGSIHVGGPADFNILNSKSIDYWCQTPGVSPISKTFFSGSIVKSE
jgi:imidazolonepropionase